ncbi:hypothetical protein JXA88_04775 [Candidatus Fermentibacteria bacterium]|nr:hypothetical protein [Candidatus Fermentibacteria bacterium]
MNLAKLLVLDRKIIFLVMALVIGIPIIVPFGLPITVTERTQKLFDVVDATPPDKAVLISTDYAPQTEPELHPMMFSLLRHCLARKIRVLVVTLYVEAGGLAEQAVETVIKEFNSRATSNADSIIYGRDIVYLGWQPPPIIPILGMGRSITDVYPVDWYKQPVPSMPVMNGINTYDDISIVVAFSGGSSPIWYVQFAQTRYGVKVGGGVTAVSVPDFYPYLESGQLSGLLAGMKGASEYEELVATVTGVPGRRKATEGMSSQSAAHLAIMAFIVFGNIGYFATKRRR